MIVLSADHVYRIDFFELVQEHLDRGAECTMVTTDVGLSEASNHATVGVLADGRVSEFAYKPDEPATSTVATEIFAYQPAALIEVLEELHRTRAGDDSDAEGLGDFGEVLVPALVERGRVYARPLAGYWRDLGRPETFFAAHAELLDHDLGLLDDPDWPIRTDPSALPPARVRAGSVVRNSLLSPGCQVFGEVVDSILGPGVIVAAGATVRDCVLFAGVRVAERATLRYVIADQSAAVGARATVGGQDALDEVGDDDLVLLGKESRVADGVVVGAGSRLEPGAVAD